VTRCLDYELELYPIQVTLNRIVRTVTRFHLDGAILVVGREIACGQHGRIVGGHKNLFRRENGQDRSTTT